MTTQKSKKEAGTNKNYRQRKPVTIRDLKVDKYLKNADKPISILVGLLAGSPIAVWIDKQMTAKKVFGMDGDKLKKWVKPGANFILGMSVNMLAKDQRFKMAGIGLAANGGLIALKELLGGKDLLKGLIESGSGSPSTVKILAGAAERGYSGPLDLPLLQIDEPGDEASEIIERAVEDDRDMNGVKGSEDIKGSPEVDLGKTEEQIAGELDTFITDDDTEMIDEIP